MSYKIILADAAWHFATRSPKGEGRSPKYKRMKLQQIKDLPVKDIADKDSVLFMWAIDPMIPQALEVIASWGFTYKTVGFYWVKENKKSNTFFVGLGYYTRANPEICLLATRGKGLKRINKGVRRLIVSKIGRHSEKPKETYVRIEKLFGDHHKRVELFARNNYPGWDAWGNEVENSISLGE